MRMGAGMGHPFFQNNTHQVPLYEDGYEDRDRGRGGKGDEADDTNEKGDRKMSRHQLPSSGETRQAT